MNRSELIRRMVGLLEAALDAQGQEHQMQADGRSPLVGGEAVVSSLALVTYILDVETFVDEEYDLQITLVNEQALSRRNSPFRSVESLADYVLELAGVPVASDGVEERKVAQG